MVHPGQGLKRIRNERVYAQIQSTRYFQQKTTSSPPRPAYSVRAVVRGAYKPLIKHRMIGKLQVGLRIENSAVVFIQSKLIRKE